MLSKLKRTLLGEPLATNKATHQRLGNLVALAVFASDALSSVAYATDEILWVLAGAGAVEWWRTLGIGLAIVGLLAIVVLSYRQTVRAYPSGGGAYIVAKRNLGELPGLTAGAALLVDYVLTAAVSVAAGVAALSAAFPGVAEHRVALCGLLLALLTLINLRGVKESGAVFATPVYAFLGVMALAIVFGLLRRPFVEVDAAAASTSVVTGGAGLFVMLRAFASGCAALSGVEAVSNGVPAFCAPEPENAARTLTRMGLILGALFFGVTLLAALYQVTPREGAPVLAQLGRIAFGDSGLYTLFQVVTALILVLAANTSFADFPRLASLMARDSFLPRQLTTLGDRLAFSNGIVLVGALAFVLTTLFGGDVHALVPLYAVGVFLSFTLSQSGMVVHWLRERGTRWGRALALNLLGTAVCALVLLILVVSKLAQGAWLVCVVIPLLVVWFRRVAHHYARAERELRQDDGPPQPHPELAVVVPVFSAHRGVKRALGYARALTEQVHAITVEVDAGVTAQLRRDWPTVGGTTPLRVLESPYRSVVTPILTYVDELAAKSDGRAVNVVLPEYVPRRAWHRALHNQSVLLLMTALSSRPDVVVTVVRVPLEG